MIALYVILSVATISFLIYFILITPSLKKRIPKEYLVAKYAHRGLHNAEVPENSMKAFELAVENGLGIELDVRFSKDKELMVFHDRTLDRVTGEKGAVVERTAKELSEIKLKDSDQTIPTFAEVLKLVDGRVPLLVEIKQDPDEGDVASAVCRMLSEYQGKYTVETFNPLALATVKKQLPSVCRGLLCDRYTTQKKYKKPLYYLLQAMVLNFLCKPDFVAYNHKAPKGLSYRIVTEIFKTPAFAWTVKSAEDEEKAIKNGFVTVIFEGYKPN